MSIFQCQHCGCRENTALSGQGCDGFTTKWYNWTGIEDRKGKKLCSACAPTKFDDGTPTAFGKWHDEFDRFFLPLGMFVTDREGNLEHRETGDKEWRRYASTQQEPVSPSLNAPWELMEAIELAEANGDEQRARELQASLDLYYRSAAANSQPVQS